MERMPRETLEPSSGRERETRSELQAQSHNQDDSPMHEATSTKQQQSEPTTNGTDPSRDLHEARPAPRQGEGELAAAIEKLLRHLEDAERAKRPGQHQAHRREVVDLASLREWLATGSTGALGGNPGSRPVAQRERAPGQEAKASDWLPAHQPSQPVKVFSFGATKTKVWVNRHAPGHVTWSIQQLRVYRGPKGQMEAKSLRFEDLSDAMRGAYHAQRWIRKHERRYRLLGWFLGF